MAEITLLFVYGTLRPGGGAPIEIQTGLRYIGPARARGWLYHVADYPGMIDDPAGLPVIGDLYALDDPATLAVLDIYEECGPDDPLPHEYFRAEVMVESDSGPARAWTYLFARDTTGMERIASGDWLLPNPPS